MPRSPGRTGHAWRRITAIVKAEETHCYRCGRELLPHLDWPDPWSTTVEHIVPLSQGGDPLARSNLAASHGHCNFSHGDGTRTQDEPTSRVW